MSIKVTSPITHMISSAVRGVAASFLGMWLFKDVITRYVYSLALSLTKLALIAIQIPSGRASSIAIILAGSIYYTWVKHTESQKPQPNLKMNETGRGAGAYSNVPLDELEAGKDTKPE